MNDALRPKSSASIWCPRIAILIALAISLFFAGEIGIRWRSWMWETTTSIRQPDEMDRQYDWGRRCAREGFFKQYAKAPLQQPGYTPLHLAVMTLWGKWSLTHFLKVEIWHKDASFALTAPLLRLNLGMECIGLLSVFFLTRHWAAGRHAIQATDSLGYFFRGWIPGIIAVLLLWFNPAVVLGAYGWPTWEVWIISIFLLAALLASLQSWFAAGIVLGVGVMLNSQALVALPVFVIWSLMLRRFALTLRLCGGILITIELIASPWLMMRDHTNWWIGIVVVFSLITATPLMRTRRKTAVASITVAIVLFLYMVLFHSWIAWGNFGFGGAKITQGLSDNLPAVLADDFHWADGDVVFTIPAHLLLNHSINSFDVRIEIVLWILFWVTLVLSSIGVGMHAKARDSRFLIALTAPWLMLFCFVPQMDGRGLIYAAGVTCICAGVSTGMTLLGIVLSLVAFLMTLHAMLVWGADHGRLRVFGKVLSHQFPSIFNDNAGAKLLSVANGTHPDLGYAVILCGLIFLYFSLATRLRCKT